MTPEDDDYEGPSISDIQALIDAFDQDDTPQPRRNGRPLPTDLNQVHELAKQHRLEPFRRGTKHPEIVFWCPICQQSGLKAAATAELIQPGLLTVNCAGCHDEIHPGILTTLATPPQTNVIPLHQNGNGTDPAGVRRFVTLLNLDDLLANPPPDPDFTWGNDQGGYLEIGTLAVLHGDGGLGKSLVGQGLCKRFTLGKEWLGQATSGGTALYLDGENSLAEIARRLYSFDIRPGEQRLKYGRVDFPILLDPAAGELLMEDLARETGAQLIVLDSQRALWGGDEREQLEVQPMYEMLARVAERLQIAILLIHHDNKSGFYSGSTAINAAVTSRLHLERRDPKNRKDRRRILWHEKSRSGPEQDPITFSVDKTPDGLMTFQIHDDDTPPPAAPNAPKARRELHERILTLLADRVPRARPEAARELGYEPSNGTFRRAWDDLHNEHALTSTDNLHWTLSDPEITPLAT